MRVLDTKRARELDDDHDALKGTPGRATLTARLPPTARSIASEVTRQLQAKGDLAGPDAHETAAFGMTGAGGSLPFLDQIQRAFGHHDISGVRVHVGGRAGEASSALGASAYASGDSVAFASSPDLHLAAHEAAHVVQQRGGVRLSGGLGRSGDEYEVNADAVADRVVRGESAQDLLDPFSHRGSSGGSAVQRQEHDGNAGVQDLERMMLRGRPTPHQVVACMRRHSGDARAILARVRERFGDAFALQVEVEVGMTAPELVPVLGSERARGTSPVGTGGGAPSGDTGGTGGLGPDAPPREAAAPPVELRGGDDSVTASVSPDAHSTVEATVGAGETSPVLRDVRVVISDSAPGGTASGELEVGADLEAGRARASVSGELSPDGEDGATLSGEASVSVGSGDEGGVDVRGSASVELRVPVGDHAVLREALIITDDGHLRVEAGADLLRRVRRLPEGNAAREPLLRLFMTVDTDMRTGERSASGGASLEVQFDRDDDDHDDPAEVRQLAMSGTSGGGSPLPHLAQIQQAFGHHDVGGVRAHVGGAAAAATGAMGARGYAYGDDVAFSASPDLRLAAHEAAHVVQQRGGVRLSGGVGRAGDEYEQHADAVAELVVRGESAQTLLDERAHRGAAGGPAVQRDLEADRTWLATLTRDAAGHYAHADGTPLTTAEQRRVRRILRAREGGAERSAPAERPGTVAREEREESTHTGTAFEATELDEDRDARAGTRGTSDLGETEGSSEDSASGGRRRRMGRLSDGSRGRVDTIDETRRRETGGVLVERHEEGRRALRVGPDRSAADVHDELERRVAGLDTRIAASTNEAERTRLRAERRRLASDMETLAEPDVAEADVTRLATRYGMGDVLEEDVTSTTTSTDRNPLDGTVGDATETARDVRDIDGSSARDVERRSRTLDIGGGSYEDRSEEEMSSTAADGSSMTERSSRTTRVEAGGGRVSGTRSRRSESSDRRADGSTDRRASERATSVGAIVTEDETGARVAHSRRAEREVGGTTLTGEASGALEVTDRRIGGSLSGTGSARRGSYTGTARASADGSFSIDITPLDDGSGQFRLTFTIHIGASGSLGLGASDTEGDMRGSASIEGRASARGDLVTSRVIDETEAQRYTAAAERAESGEEVSDPPEFGRLARFRAAGANLDALTSAGAVFGNGDTASAMADGESVMLDTEVGVGATASMSGTGSASTMGGPMSLGASGSVSGDARWRRTVQVERITLEGEPRIRMTVSYHDETERAAEATLTARVGAARGRMADESGSTDAVQFVINPAAADYDERYAAIVGTTDREELRALERRYREDVRASRHADTGAEESEYEVGPTSSAMIGMRERVHHTDDITTSMDANGDPIALSGVIEGGSDRDVRLRAGGHDIDLGGHSESVHGELDRDSGMSVDLEAAEESINPLAAVGDAVDAMSEADRRERVALVAARSPTEHLLRALQEYGHVWGYHLSEADLEAMGTRAADGHNWSACCIVPDRDVLAAWSTLRGALSNPSPDATEARIDRAAAMNIARVRALSTWMQNANGHGMECIEHVLRRWGETMTHEADDVRLGAGYEWPVELRATHTRYDALVPQCDGIRERFETALARPEGNTEARDHFNTVKAGLERVLAEIRACTDFVSESRRSELIREIEQKRADVFVRYRDFERRWAELHTESGGEPPSEAEIAETRASSSEIMAERSRAYVRAGIRVLHGNHTHETQLLQQVQAIMRDVGDSVYTGHRERADAATLCTQVHDLHRTWIQQVQDVRQAYSQAGTAESTWEVSTGPGERRNRELEPNVGWLIIEYSRVMENTPFADDWQGRVEEWREEGNDY